MPPPPTPAEPALAAELAGDTGAPRLRGVPGGYDLSPVPIHVEVRDGESTVSWLRRLSVRYDVPARDLLRTAGAKRPISATSRVTGRLRSYRRIARRLGLTDAETSWLVNPSPLVAATATYLDTFRPAGTQLRPGSRYCPQCLAAPDPHWPEHWQSPLSLVCLVHCCYLVRACPRCGQPPLASTAWLTRPVALDRCPAHPSRSRTRGTDGQGQRWCDQDLTQLNPTTAPAEQVEAQQLLHAWASGTAEHATACGVAITHRIGFQALVELLDASCSAGTDLLDLTTDPAQVAAALPAAARILTATSLDAAADAAVGMLAADGPHAPLRSTERILAYRYSPLLAAVQLHSGRDQLTVDQQLMFRTGHPLPRYPSTTTPDNRRRLRLPAHRPHWPEPDPAWVPQILWWKAVPAVFADHAQSALVRSLLAMALAKTGSTSDWTAIADHLQLPASHAYRIGRLARHLERHSSWPAVLTALERLMTGLQQHPPPIDYPADEKSGRILICSARRSKRADADTPPPSRPRRCNGSCGNGSPAATSPTRRARSESN